jgi:(2Fe-2S) ferredoxin
MDNPVKKGLVKAGVAGATRHLFLCLGPDCCDPEEGERLWERLKESVRERNLPVMRTKAACFRICSGGPWLVVYPEGVWYGGMTPEKLDRILEEHVGQGCPVEEWVSARNGCGGVEKTLFQKNR